MRPRTIEQMLDEVAAPRPSAWYGRIALVAVVTFLAVGVALALPDRALLAGIGTAVAVVASVPLFLARPRHRLVLAAIAVVGIAVVCTGDSANLGWFAVCVVCGWAALLAGTRIGVAFGLGTAVLYAGEWIFAVHDAGWGAWIAGTALTILAALLVRQQLVLVDQLRALQADLARRVRADERTRIARELHDVIAHTLTVALLHVSGARLAVEHDPDDAARALADAERLTRKSLDEVRATVGMLHTPGHGGINVPTPGLEELPRLFDDIRAAQSDVSLVVEGDVSAVPATTGTTVYRIVQESLTNSARHAPGAAVEVLVSVRDEVVEVSVDSGGRPGDGSGMGLANMRERARAVGGTCSAGPGGRGWLVTASLPSGPS
jgi:signal transduction histidine kinase